MSASSTKEKAVKRKIFVIMVAMTWLLIFSFAVGLSIAQEVRTEYKEYVIKVTGAGKVSVEPDSLRLVLSVESESINFYRATRDNTKKITAIMKEIKKLKIPNLEFSTSTFDFVGDKPDKSIWPANKYKIKNIVTVKAEDLAYDKLSDYASNIIDVAIKNGATQVKNLSFYLKDERKAQDEALKAALEDARHKASLIAKELDVVLDKPYNVLGFWFGGSQPQRPPFYDNMALLQREAEAGVRIVTGKKTFRARVELEFKFK